MLRIMLKHFHHHQLQLLVDLTVDMTDTGYHLWKYSEPLPRMPMSAARLMVDRQSTHLPNWKFLHRSDGKASDTSEQIV